MVQKTKTRLAPRCPLSKSEIYQFRIICILFKAYFTHFKSTAENFPNNWQSTVVIVKNMNNIVNKFKSIQILYMLN